MLHLIISFEYLFQCFKLESLDLFMFREWNEQCSFVSVFVSEKCGFERFHFEFDSMFDWLIEYIISLLWIGRRIFLQANDSIIFRLRLSFRICSRSTASNPTSETIQMFDQNYFLLLNVTLIDDCRRQNDILFVFDFEPLRKNSLCGDDGWE